MRKLLVYLFVTLGFGALAQDLKDGDLIFIVNPGGQGKAIQLATKSEFTHVGIVFIENGRPYVYHAVEPVSKNTLSEFVAMSADGRYQVRRLKDQQLLKPEVVAAMRKEAISRLGTHYDLAFNWSDEELYCSEFVWKLYQHHLSLQIGRLKSLSDFDLSHPAVKQQLQARYGSNIPASEKMISPGDIYNCTLLQ